MPHVAFCQTCTWTGSGEGRVNEDFAVIREDSGCAVLVDGATGLTKVNLIAGESDASWYARELCERTVDLLGATTQDEGGMPTTTAMDDAAQGVAADYLRLPGAADLTREDLPNGSVAVLRWDGDQLEVTMLGDCTAAVAMRDGSVCVVHDATLDALDQENYERMYRHAVEHGTTMAQARRALNDRFIANRLKMNEPGGYWAADITCRGFGNELVERFPMQEVAGVFACSDGFVAAVEMGVVGDAEELALRTLAGEGQRLAKELRAAERADAELWRVHRSKIGDDATYVAIAFGE